MKIVVQNLDSDNFVDDDFKSYVENSVATEILENVKIGFFVDNSLCNKNWEAY